MSYVGVSSRFVLKMDLISKELTARFPAVRAVLSVNTSSAKTLKDMITANMMISMGESRLNSTTHRFYLI